MGWGGVGVGGWGWDGVRCGAVRGFPIHGVVFGG